MKCGLTTNRIPIDVRNAITTTAKIEPLICERILSRSLLRISDDQAMQ